VNRIQTIQHDRVFVGLGFLVLIGQRLGMRPVVDAARMQGGVAWLDVVFAEEIAVVVEEELVVVGVAMEERHAQGLGVLLERPRQKAAHHRSLGHKRGMGAGRQVRAMAHDGANVAHVDLPHREVAFPAHHVDGVERIHHFRDFVFHLDAHFPLAIVVQIGRGLGRGDDAGVV